MLGVELAATTGAGISRGTTLATADSDTSRPWFTPIAMPSGISIPNAANTFDGDSIPSAILNAHATVFANSFTVDTTQSLPFLIPETMPFQIASPMPDQSISSHN